MGYSTHYVNIDSMKIKKFIKDHKYNYSDISIYAGKSENYISTRLYKFNTMNTDAYKKLCEYCHVDYSEFSTDKENVFNPKPTFRLGRKAGYVRINVNFLKPYINDFAKDNGFSYSTALRKLGNMCGKCNSYFSHSLSREVVDKKVADNLCKILNINYDDLVLDDTLIHHNNINTRTMYINENGVDTEYILIKTSDYKYTKQKLTQYISEITLRLEKLQHLMDLNDEFDNLKEKETF